MSTQWNVPKEIVVGYQNRNGTYTGKLAYVVYNDQKGKLRKAASWEKWRDKAIDQDTFKNEPTSGFVLNKDVGGGRGWDARNNWIRVYDPRDFEFEISIDNLLFILQECSAIKGKGLEGELVYAWAGAELVLLPVSSTEYKESCTFTKLQTKKITSKDMVVGCTYLTKKQEKVMYMGRMMWYEWNFPKSPVRPYSRDNERVDYCLSFREGKNRHVFRVIDKKLNDVFEKPGYKGGTDYNGYWLQSGFTELAEQLTFEPVPQYPEECELLLKSPFISPLKEIVAKPRASNANRHYRQKDSLDCFFDTEDRWNKNYSGWICDTDGKLCYGSFILKADAYRYVSNKWVSLIDTDYAYDTSRWLVINGERFELWDAYHLQDVYKGCTKEQILDMVKDVYLVCENGSEIKI